MKTDAQRRVDDLLSGKSKPSGVGEIAECPECVAARKWIAEKTGIGGGPRPLAFLIASHEQHEREIAAAEERGRRRGVEERDELRALLKEWLPTLCAVKPWPKIGSMLACGKCLGCRTLIALAPRDSGKEPDINAAEFRRDPFGILKPREAEQRYVEVSVADRGRRVSPRALDGDGLQAAMKSVRDGIADALGINDGSDAVSWRYEHRRGKPREYAVEVEIVPQSSEATA